MENEHSRKLQSAIKLTDTLDGSLPVFARFLPSPKKKKKRKEEISDLSCHDV